jgi:hypothetical protein
MSDLFVLNEDLSEIRVGCEHVDRVQVPQDIFNISSAGGNKWSI